MSKKGYNMSGPDINFLSSAKCENEPLIIWQWSHWSVEFLVEHVQFGFA